MPEINFSLTVDEINAVINMLAEQPFKLSASIISKIQAQGQAQLEAQSQAEGKE